MPSFRKGFKPNASKAKRKRPTESNNSDEETPNISESSTKRVRWDGDVQTAGEEENGEGVEDEDDSSATEKV